MDGCSARTTLGVTPNASLANIKTAYRTLAKGAHPDRGGDPLTFDRITRAYELLVAEATAPTTTRTLRPTVAAFRRPMWTRVGTGAVADSPVAPATPPVRSGAPVTFADHLRRATAA